MSRHCFKCGASTEVGTPLAVGPNVPLHPAAGDPAFCSECGAVTIYTGLGFEIRLPLGEEARALNADPQIRAAQAFLRQRRGRR